MHPRGEFASSAKKSVYSVEEKIFARNLAKSLFGHFKVNSIRLIFFSLPKIEFCANIYVSLSVGSAVGEISARVR